MEETYVIYYHKRESGALKDSFYRSFVGKSGLKDEIERIKKICGPEGYHVYNNQSREKI